MKSKTDWSKVPMYWCEACGRWTANQDHVWDPRFEAAHPKEIKRGGRR